MKLFLVRHGQTEANLNQLYVGQGESKLTELGIQQAKNLAPVLENIEFQKVYSSDISRAVQTCRLAIGKEPIQTPLLREIDEGEFCGLTVAERNEKYGGNPVRRWDYTVVNGESADMVAERLRKFLKMFEEDPCENAIAFAHNGVLGCMLRLVLDADIEHKAAISPNCAVHVYEFKDNRWCLLSWNYGADIFKKTTE